jgi:hypothetical protein
MYAEAEQRHANRMAALARYFGQAYRGPGNPDADHALAFVAEVDPNGLWTPFVAEPPIGEIATIELRPDRAVAFWERLSLCDSIGFNLSLTAPG